MNIFVAAFRLFELFWLMLWICIFLAILGYMAFKFVEEIITFVKFVQSGWLKK